MFEELGHVPQPWLAMEVPQWQHDLLHFNYGSMNGRCEWISSIVGENEKRFCWSWIKSKCLRVISSMNNS